MLSDIAPLFPVGFATAFAAGAVGGLATSVFDDFMGKFMGTGLVPGGVEVAPVVVGLMLGAFVGIGVSRHTFAARILNRPLPRVGGVALALGAGLIAGESVSFSTGIGAPNRFLPHIEAATAMTALVAAVLLTVWTRAAADAWIDALPRRGSAKLLSGVAVVTAFLWAWAWDWSWNARATLPSLSLRTLVGHVDGIALHEMTMAIVIALVFAALAPGLARGQRGRAQQVPGWALLNSPAPAPWSPRVRLRLGLAVLLGAGTGVAFFGLHLGLRYFDLLSAETSLVRSLGLWEIKPSLQLFPEDAALLTEGAGKVGFVRAHVGLALLMQLGLGVAVALQRRRGAELRAVLASVVAGIAMAASIVVVNLLHGGTAEPDFLWATTKMVVNPSVFVAVVAAAATAAVARRRSEARRAREESGAADSALPSPRHPTLHAGAAR